MTKPTKTVAPSEDSDLSSVQSDQSLLCALRTVKDYAFCRWMRRLIRLGGLPGSVFAGCTGHFVRFVMH